MKLHNIILWVLALIVFNTIVMFWGIYLIA